MKHVCHVSTIRDNQTVGCGHAHAPLSYATSERSVPWMSVPTPTSDLLSASFDDAYTIFCLILALSGALRRMKQRSSPRQHGASDRLAVGAARCFARTR